MFWPSVLIIIINLKLYKTLAMKNTLIQDKLKIQLTFNPGLELIGFWATGPRR